MKQINLKIDDWYERLYMETAGSTLWERTKDK